MRCSESQGHNATVVFSFSDLHLFDGVQSIIHTHAESALTTSPDVPSVSSGSQSSILLCFVNPTIVFLTLSFRCFFFFFPAPVSVPFVPRFTPEARVDFDLTAAMLSPAHEQQLTVLRTIQHSAALDTTPIALGVLPSVASPNPAPTDLPTAARSIPLYLGGDSLQYMARYTVNIQSHM